MNGKPPPITPNALRLDEALGRSAPLASLQARMADSNARLQAIRPVLPPGLMPHLRAGPVDDLGWSLLVANTAVAAKLRQLQPRLERVLAEAGWTVTALRIRVLQPPA